MTNATEKTDVRRPDLGMRRQILDMLHAAYDVQGQRYSGSETDKTVAEAVGSGCLFGWVAEIREEFFGPSGGNAEMDDLRKALAENAKRLDEINRRATKALADVREEIGALSKMAAEAQKETERLTKRLDSVRHAVGPKAGVRV